MPDSIGDAIDQIVTIPMRTGTEVMQRERLMHYYQEARARQGDVALTMKAAERIVEEVHEGDWIFLLAGISELPWWPAGEMDGAPGIVSLARAVSYALGARPLYLAEPLTLPTCIAPSHVAGVPVRDPELIEQFEIVRSAAAIEMPLGETGAHAKACELLDRFQPKAVVACEKRGPNAFGEYASQNGHVPAAVTDCVAPEIFAEAEKRGILTIGIGDAGNELGLGVIEDLANSYSGPTEFRQGGSGTNTKSDVAVVATVSNWGAYGIAAGIAYLTKNLDALQDEGMEARMLEACAAQGSIDFTAGVPINHADGKPPEVHQAIVTLLRTVVRGRINERPRSFIPKDFTRLAFAYGEYYTRQHRA